MSEETTKILIIEDDQEISQLLATNLTHRGFKVKLLPDGNSLLDGTLDFDPEVILLDIMLPGEDGLEICKRLRMDGSRYQKIPIIFTSALGELTDRVVGLEIGADDYLVKPFSVYELVARIRALLRRASFSTNSPNPLTESGRAHKIWKFAHWRIDMEARSLIDEDDVVTPLSSMEFKLLEYFLENPFKVLPRAMLLERVGSRAEFYDRNLDVQISRLRSKLRDREQGANLIRTMRGDGYMFNVDVIKS